MSPLAVFYEPKCITAKLKVISPLIDAKRIMALYIDPTLDIGNELFN